jgi:hypothetical protein
MLKRLIRHPASQSAAAWLLSAYLALVARTTRWTMFGVEHVSDAMRGEAGRPGTVVLAFWHEQLALMPLCWRHATRSLSLLEGARVHVLISRHRDGRLIASVAGRFGVETVHASSSQGGSAGLLALARLLDSGAHAAITPDGPRGPRRQAAPGAVHLAALCNRPLLPCGAATSRMHLTRSWDRMRLPLPLARGVLVIGAPIRVERATAETALPMVAAAMTEAADRAAAASRSPQEAGRVAAG